MSRVDTRPAMSQIFGLDAYAPKEIAARVSEVGVAKARLPLLSLTLLGAPAPGKSR